MNDSQQRSILIGFQDIHRRLAEFESILVQRLISSPFSQYVDDLSPTEAKVIHDYFNRLRAAMVTCLNDLKIPLEVRRTSARWALQCGMIFLHIAVSELSPERLRGYGALDAEGQTQAHKLQQELNRLIDRMAAYLNQGLGKDLAQRLSRLDAASIRVDTLKLLDRVVTRWGLVEFRPMLDRIVQRLEAPRFEIAVFGRVSSGKSSLLNHLAGMDVLPVGVTPITAVPTRLVRGERARAIISFAEMAPQTIEVRDLGEYASETGNPGNRLRVADILVQLPAARLQEGIVLVDTPGVGSLALSGSAETYSYLPNCDLGVLLIDAAAALNQEDLDLLRLLTEAGTPAQVLLSKADLLSLSDRQRTVRYIQEQVQKELGLELPVHPVSTVGADEALLTQWFDREIAPLFARHRTLVQASLKRKTTHLCESVRAVLQTMAARARGSPAEAHGTVDLAKARQLLDRADVTIRRTRERCRDWTTDESSLLEIFFQDAAQAIIASRDGQHARPKPPVLTVMQELVLQRGQMALQVVTELQKVLGSTLNTLQSTMPLAEIDASAVTKLAFRGMPSLDHLPEDIDREVRSPWFASLMPSLAVWTTRRTLQHEFGKLIQEQVELADRQILAWMKSCLDQLIGTYEEQAEIVLQQVRRLGDGQKPSDLPATDADQIAADLRELEQQQEKPDEATQAARLQPVPDGHEALT